MKKILFLLIAISLCFADNIPNIRPFDDTQIPFRISGKWLEDRQGVLHSGIDYAICYGTGTRSTADGVVERCEMAGRYGFLIVIDHGNGYHTFYAHLSAPLVLKGMTVTKGQQIAKSGNSGNVPAHLHYALWKDGVGFIFPYVRK